MSFNEAEISTMLNEYANENKLLLDIELLSKEIYKFTSGYPFLVSRICQIVDEDLLSENKREWTVTDIQKAVKFLLEDKNTLFDDLIKNLENNSKLYECLYNILISGLPITYNINNPIIDLGHMFGYLVKGENNNIAISNKILKEVIYNYMVSKTDSRIMSSYNFKDQKLEIHRTLKDFNNYIMNKYSKNINEITELEQVAFFNDFLKETPLL